MNHPTNLVAGFTDRMLDANPLNEQSRQRWAMMVAAMAMRTWDMVVINTVVAGGEDLFIERAHLVLHGHAFHKSDYRRIFAVLKRASASNQKVSLRLILDEAEVA